MTAMKLSRKKIKNFRELIFSWWKDHHRDLPWRHTHDPYKIMVSEVMLQQTQVARVLPKYGEFIERYPSVHDLAKALTSDVLKTWKGMGYNRRALYLKQAAQRIVKEYRGKFPKNEKKKAIPFRESDRFYRGRIIDRLREGNIRESVILKEFQTKYGKSREFTRTILSGLENDGLLA